MFFLSTVVNDLYKLRKWKRDKEGGAFPNLAGNLNVAAMVSHNILANGEAKSVTV